MSGALERSPLSAARLSLKTCRWELLVLPFFPSPTHISHHTGTGNSHRLLPLVSSPIRRPSPSAPRPSPLTPPILLPSTDGQTEKECLQSSAPLLGCPAALPPPPPSCESRTVLCRHGAFRLHIFALSHARGRKRVVRTASEAIGVNWVRLRLAVADWSKRHWAAAPCRPGAAQLARIRATTQIPDSTWLSPPWVVPTSPADGLHEGTTTATDGPPTTSLLLPPSLDPARTPVHHHYHRHHPSPRQTDHHRPVHCRYTPSPVRPPFPVLVAAAAAAATAARSATSAT